MTCIRRTRSPETAEDNSFRPYFRRIECGEVGLLDDKLERLEEPVTRLVFFNVDDVDAHRQNVGPNLVGCNAAVDAADVAVDGEWSSTPGHGAAARLLADDNISVLIMRCFHSNFRGSLHLFSIMAAAGIWHRESDL